MLNILEHKLNFDQMKTVFTYTENNKFILDIVYF